MIALDRLAVGLQEITGAVPPHHGFDGWACQVLKDRSPGGGVKTGLPGSTLPDDAVRYAQGCLEQPRHLHGTGRRCRRMVGPCDIAKPKPR